METKMYSATRSLLTALLHGKRRALLGAVVAIGLCLPLSAAADEVIGSFTGAVLGQPVSFVRNDAPRGAWAGTLGFRLDSGEELLVFCIQLDVGVGRADRYRSAGPVEDLPNGCQIRYVLDNYPGSTAASGDEAAARQMAIWHYSDDVDLTTIVDDHVSVRDRAIEIAEAAATGPCPTRRTEAPDLQLQPASAQAGLGQRLAYAVTAGALDAGQPIQVALTGPAVLDNGQQQVDLVLDDTGAAMFGVTSTGVGTSTVQVELPYRLEAGTVFSQYDDSQPTQRLVMAQHADLVAQAVAEANWVNEATPTVPAPTATVPTAPAPTETAGPASPTVVAGTTATVQPSQTPSADKRTPKPTDTAPGVITPAPELPSALPRTGAPDHPPWLAAGIAALLVGLGWEARRRVSRASRPVG